MKYRRVNEGFEAGQFDGGKAHGQFVLVWRMAAKGCLHQLRNSLSNIAISY
jgi:hypothetical protein